MWGEITYPIQNLNIVEVEVWKLIHVCNRRIDSLNTRSVVYEGLYFLLVPDNGWKRDSDKTVQITPQRELTPK